MKTRCCLPPCARCCADSGLSRAQWVSVTLGLLSGEFICHRRRPYTVVPEGRLDTLRWLSLPLSAFPLSLHISSPCLLLSLPINIPPSLAVTVSVLYLLLSTSSLPSPSCYLSACAPLSQDCEQVTVVERGGPPESAMRGTDGPPCPFSKTVATGYSIKMRMMYFNPSFLLELTAKLV